MALGLGARAQWPSFGGNGYQRNSADTSLGRVNGGASGFFYHYSRWKIDQLLAGKAPITGGSGYIQNQNAGAQTANAWISGSYRSNSQFQVTNVGDSKSAFLSPYRVTLGDDFIMDYNNGNGGVNFQKASTNPYTFNVSGTNRLTIGNGELRVNSVLYLDQVPATDAAPTQIATIDAGTGEVKKVALSAFTATVATIADLQAYSGSATTVIVSENFRGGTFNYDNTGTYSTDGGIVFSATGKGGGVWRRDISQAQGIHVKWFGAKGDWNLITNTGTDDWAAIQAAINAKPNRNTPVIFDYGVYGVSDSLVVGEGTYLKGLSTLFPKQFFGDGSISINYSNMTAVKFYNATNGFVTTLGVVGYRSQGLKATGLGIFGSGKTNGKTGYILRQTANSTLAVKTTGLVTMEDVYFSGWGTGTSGLNSADTWYLERVHFDDMKIGLIGGTGQTFLHHTDFFKIDSIGMVLNSANDPDVVSVCEIETRYAANAAIIVNGRAIINNTEFLTNKKSIVFSSTATGSNVNNSTFIGNSDTDITINSGAIDIQLIGNKFNKNYTGGNYNYNFVLESPNYSSNSINASTTSVQLTSNYFIKSSGSYIGAPVVIDGSTISSAANTYRGYTYTNDENVSFTGSNIKNDGYDINGRKIVGNALIGGTLGVTGVTTLGANLGVTGSVTGNSYLFNADATYSVGSTTNQAFSMFSSLYRSKSGSPLSLRTIGANSLNFGTSDTDSWRLNSSNHLYPLTDNAYTLGISGNRMSNIYTNNLQIGLAAGVLMSNGANTNIRLGVAGTDYVSPTTGNATYGTKTRTTASGTGVATTISIAHGLSGVTSSSWVSATANNAAAAGISYVTVDATNINIIYTVAPAVGTNNLIYSIEVRP